MRVTKCSTESVTKDNLENKELIPGDNTSVYHSCIEKLKEAIFCLGPIAKQDELAKEAIANISVVIFDLQ